MHEETQRLLQTAIAHYQTLAYTVQTVSNNANSINSTMQALQYRVGELQMNITNLHQNNWMFDQVKMSMTNLQNEIMKSTSMMHAGFNTLENKAKEMHQLIDEYEKIARDPVVTKIISDIREFSDRIDDVIREGG